MHVLLVEDDPLTGETVRTMLQAMTHHVTWAHTGKQALTRLKEGVGFDLVLTDILMPDMDGIEIIQHLRKTLPNLPVMAMTGRIEAPYLRAALLFGVRATLEKPFSFDELQAALNKALQKPS